MTFVTLTWSTYLTVVMFVGLISWGGNGDNNGDNVMGWGVVQAGLLSVEGENATGRYMRK